MPSWTCYMTRVQKGAFLDEEVRARAGRLRTRRRELRTARPDMIVLHPLPRVNEIAPRGGQ
ncbi:MAG: hypothetical protein ACLS37_11810 [Alistipes sp.]